MAREIEQLRAEQMNADRRARGLGELSLSLSSSLSVHLSSSLSRDQGTHTRGFLAY